jgi:hypothetical protein
MHDAEFQQLTVEQVEHFDRRPLLISTSTLGAISWSMG